MVNQGEKAPNFTLPDTDRKPRSLNELLKPNGATLLAFFPGAFTTVCTREMCTLRDNMQELNKINAQVVGITATIQSRNKPSQKTTISTSQISTNSTKEVVNSSN